MEVCEVMARFPPASVTLPATASRSFVPVGDARSNDSVVFALVLKPPTVSVPTVRAVAPGLMVPDPETLPVIVPLPPRVPPFSSTLPVPVPEPVVLFTNKVPLETVVVPA